MSAWSWLFGEGAAGALRGEVAHLRAELTEQRDFWRDRVKALEAHNSRLREELLILNSSAAQAQLEAYRIQRRTPPPPAPTPEQQQGNGRGRQYQDLGTAMNLTDTYADGVIPDDDVPSADDAELERQIAEREARRLEAFQRIRADAKAEQEG